MRTNFRIRRVPVLAIKYHGALPRSADTTICIAHGLLLLVRLTNKKRNECKQLIVKLVLNFFKDQQNEVVKLVKQYYIVYRSLDKKQEGFLSAT